jgi:hypothetical protein
MAKAGALSDLLVRESSPNELEHLSLAAREARSSWLEVEAGEEPADGVEHLAGFADVRRMVGAWQLEIPGVRRALSATRALPLSTLSR